jgi:hypothetical protein
VPVTQIPNIPDNAQFVQWCYQNVLKQPEKINTNLVQRTIAVLNLGYETGQTEDGKPTKIPVDRQKVLQNMFGYIQQYNQLEQIRFERLVLGKKQDVNALKFAEI